ncbi:MAG: hypothetical protein KDE22_19245 [Rhodobacterales bacterium]|nr:hypothetical protein [Rhodobacterales bacterium]
MRTVSYYYGGHVADFRIPDERFTEFTTHVNPEVRFDTDQLEKAQRLLEAFMRSNGARAVGPGETVAACFVWNFFNNNPDPDHVIEGDVVIVDLDGDGGTIEYAAVGDVPMKRESVN